MNEKDAEKYFINLLNGCYCVKSEDFAVSIFWFHDKSIVREKKLCKVLNSKPKLKNYAGECIFEMDFFNEYFWIRSDIWDNIKEKFSISNTRMEKLTEKIFGKYVGKYIFLTDSMSISTFKTFEDDLEYIKSKKTYFDPKKSNNIKKHMNKIMNNKIRDRWGCVNFLGI